MTARPATELARVERMVDQVLKARAGGVSAGEAFLVEILEIFLLAAAERLIELGAEPDGSEVDVGGRSGRARKSRRTEAGAKGRRPIVH